MIKTLQLYSRLLRTGQWYKNLLIFAPLLFAQNVLAPLELGLAFLGFCALSSFTYICNDWLDREKDRLHPTKKDRPLASGKVSGKSASVIAMALLLFVGWTMSTLGLFYTSVLLSYLVLTTLYSFGLKNIPLLDIFLITANFILRASAGLESFPSATVLPFYGFIAGMIFLFLTHKRRSDNKLLGEKALEHKPVLAFYSPFVCHILRAGAFILIAFCLYAFYKNGWPFEGVLAIFVLLSYTSYLLSRDPFLTSKPQHLLKNPLWTTCLIVMGFLLAI